MLRVHDRISEVPQAEHLIVQLDDHYGGAHTFATLMGLDLVTAKTAVPKNAPVGRSLLLWTFEVICGDLLAKRTQSKMPKDDLILAIHRALLKKRVVTYVANKCKGEDCKGQSYERGRSPSEVMGQVFSTMESFRLSGLASTTCATLSWLGHLPSWQAEAIQFLSKMLRGHVAIDNQLDKALAGDHLISAEAMFQGDAWTSAGLFDITLVLQQKAEEAEAQKRDAEVEKAKEEAEKNGAKEKTETTKLPEAEKVDEPMPEIVLDKDRPLAAGFLVLGAQLTHERRKTLRCRRGWTALPSSASFCWTR